MKPQQIRDMLAQTLCPGYTPRLPEVSGAVEEARRSAARGTEGS